ncbi:MAG: hypothetical protein KatS3mg035_0490 [Bacteroidia bacterium]|nr:MAG: hypothetical protein KatS3mg035_0490 [Bacteroidia bacterium]
MMGKSWSGTNLDGRYSIEMDKAEPIKIKVSFIGYKEQEIEIKNIKEEKIQRNIELVAEGTTTEEVIVTDSRYEKKSRRNHDFCSHPKAQAIRCSSEHGFIKSHGANFRELPS